jgi:uncharacterized protein YcnI
MTELVAFLPLLALVVALAFGVYPGEEIIARLGRRSDRVPRESRPVPPAPRTAAGNRQRLALLATSRPTRGPPLLPPPQNWIVARRPAGQLTKGNSMRRIAIATATICALLLPAAAQAHVTLQPNEAPAGGFTVLDVRVPNERDDANTTKIDVKFPPGFAEVSYQAVPGWQVKVIKEKLANPVQTDDGPVTEGVSEIVWSGGSIAPGQFQDFPLSVQIPDEAGKALTFKALQTYDNGEVVRWIGPPESEEPAPQVMVTAAEGGHSAAAAESGSSGDEASDGSDSASKGLGIAALVLGALGLLAGGAALMRSRGSRG